MNKTELIEQIATGRTVAERLPLYEAAMHLGLLTFQEIQLIVHSESVPAIVQSPIAKKATAKKAVAKRTA